MLMQPDTPAARSFVLLKCSWVGRGEEEEVVVVVVVVGARTN